MQKQIDVLIVDDDQNMRRTLAQILTEDGYSVVTAGTGEEAVALCRETIFRLVLMDVRMPGIDGLEAFRQIRRHCKRSQVALMSAYASSELEKFAALEGILTFFRKPVDLSVVIKLIAEITSISMLYVGPADAAAEELHKTVVEAGFRFSQVADVSAALRLMEQVGFDVLVLNDEPPSPAEALATLHAAAPESEIYLLRGSAESATTPEEHFTVLQKATPTPAIVLILERHKQNRLGVPATLPPPASA